MMYNYIFDVGAHHGEDSVNFIKKKLNWKCIAFEANPEVADYLSNITESIRERYTIVRMAVSDYDGESDFNLNPYGCSSLHTFKDTAMKRQPRFRFTSSVKIPVTRLDTWISKNAPEITKIEHLHIDAQGSDLEVAHVGIIASGELNSGLSEVSNLNV